MKPSRCDVGRELHMPRVEGDANSHSIERVEEEGVCLLLEKGGVA